MTYCESCGRKIGYCVDSSTRRKVILDVDQKVYTPMQLSDTADVDNGFWAIQNTLSAAVHLCRGKK
jgi:hypothetical protein